MLVRSSPQSADISAESEPEALPQLPQLSTLTMMLQVIVLV
jgi:hypothetical protein